MASLDTNKTTQDPKLVASRDSGPFCPVCGPASPCEKDHG